MSRPTPTTYRTGNWPAYNAALKRRGSLTIWFDPAMNWDAAPTGRRGRQRTYSNAAVQTCLSMKVLFGMALRQTTGFVESLLRLVGLDWTVPDFSTLSRRQKTLAVNIPYRGSKGPLHLLIDSTGIKVEGEGEWHARKHGGSKRRVWRKIHLGIDEETLEVRAVEVTECAFHVIRPSVPRASGRAFHEHPATLVRGLRGFSSLLIASPAVKGVGGAEGCPREGPARPAPRRPGGWRCRARGRGRWASRGEGHAHCPASARLSAPVLRSDGPSRAMR